jgi:hypothetical protein
MKNNFFSSFLGSREEVEEIRTDDLFFIIKLNKERIKFKNSRERSVIEINIGNAIVFVNH